MEVTDGMEAAARICDRRAAETLASEARFREYGWDDMALSFRQRAFALRLAAEAIRRAAAQRARRAAKKAAEGISGRSPEKATPEPAPRFSGAYSDYPAQEQP